MSLIGRSLNGHYTDYSNEEEEKREILITPNDTSSQCIERKLMEYILREIELITTVIRQHLARSQHKTRPIATANLLKHLTHTRRSLSLSSSLSRYECIYPFCLVIKQNESPSSITAVSIHCITNILNDSLFLNTNTPQIQQCVQCIGHAICGVTLDVEQKEFDEGLLLKFMNLISCLLHHSCFIFLSESMICNIFDKLLYIYWNVNADHHSQALFAFAEISINLLIQKVFQTLPSLMHPTKQTNNVKTVHVKKTTATGYVSLKDKILQKTQAQDTNPPLEAPFNIGCLVRILSALCSGDPCSYVEGETPQMDYNELNENRLILCLNLILIALRESGECFVPPILSLMTDNLCSILLHFGGHTKYIMLYELCLRTHIQLLYKLRHKIKLQNEMLFRMLFIRVLRDGLPQLLNREHMDDCLFDTDRVDDILSKKQLEEEEEKEPLPPQKKKTYDVSAMSLMTNDGSVVSSNAAVINKESVVSSNTNQKVKDKFVVCCLEHLLDLVAQSWFIKELFLNYDCNLYSSNLCSDLISLLSKHTIPGDGVLLSKQYLALQCLVNASKALNVSSASSDMTHELLCVCEKKKILQHGIDIFNARDPEKAILYLYESGMFGRSIPRRVFSKGKNIDRDEILRVIDCTDIVDQIVDILFYCSSLSDVRIGYYLGSQHILNCAVLDRYIARRYSLVGLSLDCAMRLFFEDFRLPVETQQVDRIVDSFASKYCLDNDSIWCLSASATYTLCFALMMLHTNQHNQSIAHDKHMKLEEFVNLVRTVKDAADIECQLLEQLYLSITRNEIRLKHDTQSNNLSKLNWNLWIRRADNESYIQHTMCNANPQILNIIFAPLSTTFALILDSLNQITTAIDKDALVTIICDGFYHLALFISNTSSATCCMDELMLCLSRISDILKPLSYSKSYAKKEISHLLFSILYSFGANCLTAAGWNHIIQIIMQCAQTNLLPVTMCQLDDFVGGDLAGRPSNRSFKYLCQMKKKHNTKRKTETNATEGTLFGTISAFIDYLNISVDDDETLQSQKDAKSIRSAQIVLSEFCRIHFVIKKSAQFEIESVRCLMTALINNSSFGILNKSDFAAIKMMSYAEGNVYKEGDEYILQRSCLCVQFLTSVLLHNWRRMEFIWDSIRKHLLALLDDEDRIYKTLKDTKYIELHEVMVECGVICILKICVRSLQLPCTESTQSLMPCLFELICSLSVEQFHRYPSVSYQITAAIHRFIKQIYDKKKQYFRSLTTESISAADPIHRVRNAKQLSNYKWWCVTPFDHIFALIKTALHRQYLYDVCVTIFLHILGLNEDKLLFLDSNCSSMELCQLMDSACELLRVFIDQSSADDRVMTMLIAAIRNVCTQMQYFYAELKIKDNGKDEPGKTNKKQRCFEYILQLLNYLIALCGNGSRSNQALRAVEYVLFLDSNDDFMDSKTILNMICTQLIMIQLASPAITSKARVCGIRLLNKYFVTHLEQLQPIGKEIVMKILCCCDVMVEIGRKYHKKCDLNQLYSNIKQNLKNVLIVLIDKSILKMNINPNDNDDDISISTWHKINDMFPTIRSELSAQCKHQQRDQNHIHPTPTPYDHDLLLQQDLVL
eukprot:553867_1